MKLISLYICADEAEITDFYDNILPTVNSYQEVGNPMLWYLFSYESKLDLIDTNDTLVLPTTASSEVYLNAIVCFHHDMDALIYSGHSGGEYLGRETNPTIQTEDFSKILHECLDHRLKFIYFDSCNMGTIPWIGYLSGVTEYVIASPNYYDWESILCCGLLYTLNFEGLDSLRNLVDTFAEKSDQTPNLIEIGIYDPEAGRQLWNLLCQHSSKLVPSKISNIEDEIFDVYMLVMTSYQSPNPDDSLTYAEYTKLLDAINKTVLYRKRCYRCADEVPSSLLGITLLEYKKSVS